MMKLKKIIAAVFSLVIMLSLSIPSYALSKAENATYVVNVEMLKADSDETSYGNKYIAPKGVLEVKDGKMTLTIAVLEGDDMKMWYYPGQSTDGDTAEVTKKTNVDIDGKTYDMGFVIPVESDTAYVKFHASVMPFSPSARIRMDLSSAKVISKEETTQAETTTVAPDESSSTVTDKAVTDAAGESTSPAGSTTGTSAQAAEDLEIETAAPLAETESSSKAPVIIICAVAVLIIAAVIIIIAKRKNKKGKKNK